MAMTQRAKWMAATIAEVFGINEYDVTLFSVPQFKHTFDEFFEGVGPDRILVYYQSQFKVHPETGEIQEYNQGHKEFFVTDGEKIKLKGKCVYFLRTKRGEKVSQSVYCDDSVVFGEVSEHSVKTLNYLVNQIYKPMVDRMDRGEWGNCTKDQVKEFTDQMSGFSTELSQALKSLDNRITLPPYPENYKADVKNYITSGKQPKGEMFRDFHELFTRWSGTIQQALDGADSEKIEGREPHPLQELEFWKQRMRKLTGIAEQIKSKNCKDVLDVLTQYAMTTSPGDQGNNNVRNDAHTAISSWRSIDLRVTEALNEAKDNVKYLQTLEKFIEPLYHGTPDEIKETLPALMNSIKMIHTIARYYNTNERMTSLFVKITNQMIKRCKYMILNPKQTGKKGDERTSSEALWDYNQYPPSVLIPMLESCIELNKAYQKQYDQTKQRLMKMPKGKQFEFSTIAIFGKFNLFSRRVSKLIDLFSTIEQFRILQKHNLENIQPILKKFDDCWKALKSKKRDLLDQNSNTFDRDFVEFNVAVSDVETDLQAYIDSHFQNITSIEGSLKMLRKFQAILHRDNLQHDLKSKYSLLFYNYGLEINSIIDLYDKNRPKPPVVRNLPTVSGRITWSRHLFYRISGPMEKFPKEHLEQRDSKKTIKNYNKIGYTLFSYEYSWREIWIKEVENAKAGLQATLIVRHPENNKLYVNFDKEILTLIREAKCLTRIGIDIPESAKIVLLQEDKFKMYNNELTFVLSEYDRIVNKIRPNTKSLLVPHLEDLEYKLRPGMVTLTWTSMNIDGYLAHVHAGLAKLEQLIININDIMENRIENNLKALSKTVLVNLPQDARTFTLEEFVSMQEEWIKEESEKLKSKNYEVEGAVEDLIQTICSYQLDQHVEPISAEEIQKLSKYYNWSMYQALLHATKYSLNQMKERICGRRHMPKQILKPFFEVDVHLEGENCTLRPSLEEVQSAINRAASHVLKSTKHVQNWNQKDLPEDEREPFYDWIAKDKEIVKVILLLTGSIQGTKNNVNKFLESFDKFSWLWKDKIDEKLKKFNTTNPQLEDFEEKLVEFTRFEEDIGKILDTHQIGALSLKTNNVKIGLKKWIVSWKEAYAKDLHKRAKTMMEDLKDNIKQIRLKIEKPAKDIDSLGNVMHALEEIRTKQAEIEINFRPVIEMCNLLEQYLPPETFQEEDMDPTQILDKEWGSLVERAIQSRNELQGQQAVFKKNLVEGIRFLKEDVIKFREDFVENGPMVTGIEPKEALNRLKQFSEEYSIRKRKYDLYHAGEKLFGLPHQNYPQLTDTQKDIELLDKLYSLYSKVKDTISKWKDIAWVEVQEEIEKMTEQIETFGRDCTKLPGALKQRDAFKELRTEIDNMTEIIPLVEALAKPTIRPRHWQEIIEMCKVDIPFESEGFNLDQLLKAPLLNFKEDIEDITDSADKQAKLEKQLNNEIQAYWEIAEFEIKMFKGVDTPSILGGNILDIQERFEEHIMQLNQMNAMRYVKPFKVQVTEKIGQLGECQDTVEKWLKVQNLWTNLVSVFLFSKSIASELPTETKKFKGIHKNWLKIMEKAYDTKNVIQCCTNDLLKQQLPVLQEGLEFCQKKLENFLESKRSLFPRFYFVSGADLLSILSMGSDPYAVQDDFEKLFDAIHKVKFDEINRKNIKDIRMVMGRCEEDVQLLEQVVCEGNIEEWLIKLEQEMVRSVRSVCAKGASDCFAYEKNLKDFITQYQSQVALLGIQIIWAQRVEECLERTLKEKERSAEFARKTKDFQKMKDDLVELCLTDLDKLQRCKVETLVTIHVHQVDVFREIRMSEIKDASDFDWAKNTRCRHKAEDNHIYVQVTDVDFQYQYEFLGAKERLCVTALTDRCYVTLAQALGMNYGGAPAGPAGTGKTETVKDLGRTLGIFVVVTNCSDEHKFRDMAKIFKGICQSGLWGCFDEFNRISLATLSVVAAQVESITEAKKKNEKQFYFPGEDPSKKIRLKKQCAYFITMNPGYAGRQELPENLKVLFRGVTMMKPDRRIIMMVKLSSVGYRDADNLSYKFNELYKLCEEQLSAQRHYDFGLRNILSVLRTAGNSKRQESEESKEEMIISRTLRDMNLSKFVAQDIPLFSSLLKDIFPKNAEPKKKEYKQIENAVRSIMKDRKLQEEAAWFTKIVQLYETSLVRHGFMVVGSAGCGKTTIMNCLTDALTAVSGSSGDQQTAYRMTRMNPKSIKGQEMYGVMNPVSGEWIPGVFSEIWKRCNDKKQKNVNWIVCDGPVDAIWIENLNTVLDDNKILTLANAERIPMSDLTKMVFEVENLDNASPATVSRCGIIYVSSTDLGWSPLVKTWLEDRKEDRSLCNSEEDAWMRDCVDKYIKKPEMFKMLSKDYHYVMECQEVIRINQMLNLMTAILEQYKEKQDIDRSTFEKYFVYCLAWSCAGLMEQEQREAFHKWLESRNAPLPAVQASKVALDKETLFDYSIEPKSRQWKLWEAEAWNPPKRIMFSQLLIPTADSTRAEAIIQLIASLHPVRSVSRKEPGHLNTLLVGGSGTAKTSVILMYCSKFNSEQMLVKRINFSSATQPFDFQSSVESEVDKKQSRVYAPPQGKKMTVFLDDMSMPFVNLWGDQITLEITRQLIEQKGFYFLDKDSRGHFRQIEELQFLGAMMHPGNGRNDIPMRLKRHFFSLNMTPPSTRSIENIYGRILEVLFNPKKYAPEVIGMRPLLIDATIAIWDAVKRRLLPTPQKFHYVFTIRELARVFQGICTVAAQPEYKVIQNCLNLKQKVRPELFLIALWRHECDRTFVDKLIVEGDKKIFSDLLDRVTKEKFRDSLGLDDEQLMTDYLFCDFMREDEVDEYGDLVAEAPFVYEACPDMATIRGIANAKLEAYNTKNPSKQMNLVIFDDALKHLLRITRTINTPGGHILLVGVGGSGKQSLTKLASFITQKIPFQISLTKSYGESQLKDNIRELYTMAGPQGKSVAFVMTDAEIKYESFLEAINSMLATGEIPGLIPKEDRDVLALECKNVYVKEIAGGSKAVDPSTLELWSFFINRVKDQLHMVLAFSPVGTKFRERSQKFPSLFSQCAIDWFLPWPEEALVAVSNKFLSVFPMDTKDSIKAELECHMGKCHQMVIEVSEMYFQRMRRHVYVTPKSYLSFIRLYQDVYKDKYDGIDVLEANIIKGLDKLEEAAQGVEEMKVVLKKEEIKLREASEEVEKVLKDLEVENKKIKEKSEEVNIVKKNCVEQKNLIQAEKEEADRDLAIAMPYLEKALAAADSIKANEIKELSQIKNAQEATRLIMDSVHILFMRSLDPVKERPFKILKQDIRFVCDSFDGHCKSTLASQNFLKDILDFSENQKDNINEETIELLEPYLTLRTPKDEKVFDPSVAKNTSQALVGLCTWAAAMSDYHKQSKIVKPKLLLLEQKQNELQEAQEQLAAAEAELERVNAIKEALRKKYDEANGKKTRLEENAAITKAKMDKANRLINSLADNKNRWIQNANEFKSLKQRLTGDVAKACAFVSYCGPFNSEFRQKLLDDYFHADILARSIPVSEDLQLTQFLVDEAKIGEWSLEGLPSDELSIQNGIMVERSSRYPLMIDPQSQAITWIKNKEKILLERDCISTLTNPKLKDVLKLPLEEGWPFLIENVENEVDPMLDPILEKQYVKKGKNYRLKIADQDVDYDINFRLYMTSRLANPHFSPELAAKTTIIDFTVTQGGLEQQLLSRLIQKEQKSLEDQLTQLQEEVTSNTKQLKSLEDQLLDQLANAQGSLLDDDTIVEVLATIKTKSKEVNEKLKEAKEKRIEINDQRENFRPAAARGAVLYFCVVEMILVNWMYNTSLGQFLGLFYAAIDGAAKDKLQKNRVENIKQELTMRTYRYISRGLFERDKITFKIMMCTKILIKDGKLQPADVGMFLKAGAGIDDRNKIFSWMGERAWLNLKALSKHRFNGETLQFFKELPDRIQRNENEWQQQWYELADPENAKVPDYQEKISADASIGSFIRLCLVRCLREDRTLLAANMFIADVLGEAFVRPVTDLIQEIYAESSPSIPILYLLSAGADPTGTIREFAKKLKQSPDQVSMGEEQELQAEKYIDKNMQEGKWVILSNCHLSLEYMAQLEEVLHPKDRTIHPDFRLWISCEPHREFPLSLLQMAIKCTIEPPKGIQAGLYRTFTTMINQDFLEKVEPYEKWRALVYSLCFMHTIVQERRKFGPLGFSVPYEFNFSDLQASLTFVETHMTQMQNPNNYSWKAMQYMVCDVQYGGRITDGLDRELFNTYGALWITKEVFNPGYCFMHIPGAPYQYCIPDAAEHAKYLEEIGQVPAKDVPPIFGLNPNADLTFRLKESSEMLSTLLDTQPKDASSGGGLSKEDQVKEKINSELLKQVPEPFNFIDIDDRLKTLKGGPKQIVDGGKMNNMPLNIFLRQELERFQKIVITVRHTLKSMVDAIDGTTIMTPEIVESINAVFDFRVPYKWQFDPTGAEISWMTASLGGWMKGLEDRHFQLKKWIIGGERPQSFWLTGFFNPQGFLTAMKQEVARTKKSQGGGWPLDEVVYDTEVTKDQVTTDDGRLDNVKLALPGGEGVLVHGLYLEGAIWGKNRHLDDHLPTSDYFNRFPFLHVTAIFLPRNEKERQAQAAGTRGGGKTDYATKQKYYYDCPVYKYPKRSDRYLVFRCYLKPEGSGKENAGAGKSGLTAAMKWRLSGVALLACKD